jgi:pyrimidine operon attenuation protein/uracil phosphoribosyltransferase
MSEGKSETLLDPTAVARGLRRVAVEIAERGRGVRDLALVGIRRGGVPLAQRLAALILEIEGTSPPVGALDITLYRDDAATALPNPRIGPSHVPFAVEGRRVVLVDDVLYTGRTIRAVLNELFDYGRPASVELAVLVDRGGRELPIQPDYVVRAVEVDASRRVEVVEREGELWAIVVPSGIASHPPPASPTAPAASDGSEGGSS